MVEEAIELVAEDFRLLTRTEIMDINEKYVSYPDSNYYNIDTFITWVRKILVFNGIDEETFINSV